MIFSDMNMKFTVLRKVKLCILAASTNVADQSAAYIFKVEDLCSVVHILEKSTLLPGRWRQHVPPKR